MNVDGGYRSSSQRATVGGHTHHLSSYLETCLNLADFVRLLSVHIPPTHCSPSVRALRPSPPITRAVIDVLFNFRRRRLRSCGQFFFSAGVNTGNARGGRGVRKSAMVRISSDAFCRMPFAKSPVITSGLVFACNRLT